MPAACQPTVDGSRVINQLQQPHLRLLIAFVIMPQVSAVLRGIAEPHQLGPVLDGAGQLMPGPVVLNVVYHSVVFVCVLSGSIVRTSLVSSPSAVCKPRQPPTIR